MLNQGMHATVFKCYAKDDIDRLYPMAVKVVREEDEEKIMVHQNEFKITFALNHTNIVKSTEIFTNNTRKEVHQVMEYVNGMEIFDQISEMGAYTEMVALIIFE